MCQCINSTFFAGSSRNVTTSGILGLICGFPTPFWPFWSKRSSEKCKLKISLCCISFIHFPSLNNTQRPTGGLAFIKHVQMSGGVTTCRNMRHDREDFSGWSQQSTILKSGRISDPGTATWQTEGRKEGRKEGRLIDMLIYLSVFLPSFLGGKTKMTFQRVFVCSCDWWRGTSCSWLVKLVNLTSAVTL